MYVTVNLLNYNTADLKLSNQVKITEYYSLNCTGFVFQIIPLVMFRVYTRLNAFNPLTTTPFDIKVSNQRQKKNIVIYSYSL